MKKLILLFSCIGALLLLSLNAQGKACNITYVSTGDSVYCPGDIISFTMHSTPGSCCMGASTYNWYRNGVLITTNHTYLYTATDTGTYYAHNTSGCYDHEFIKHFHVKYLVPSGPGFPVTGYTSVCSGNSYTYSVEAVYGGTYAWTFPPDWTGSSTTRTITVVPNSSGVISVSVITECGTLVSIPLNVVCNTSPPAAPISILGNNPVCYGSTNTYSVLPVVNATGYNWHLGYNVYSNLSNTVTYNPSSTGPVIDVSAINGCGSSAYQTMTVTVNPLLTPAVSITTSETTICAGTNVVLTATAVNGGTAPLYNWFKNGISVQNSSSNTYSSNGFANNDAVTCVITANNVCQATSNGTSNSIIIYVSSGAPGVSISTPSFSICTGASATFTATPVLGGTSPSYNWFNNGTSVQNSTSNTYTSSSITNGSVINCVITSNETCVTATTATSNPITMAVNSSILPGVTLTPSVNNFCSGAIVTYTATPSGGGSSPTYNFIIQGISYQNTASNTYTHTCCNLYNGYQATCVMTSNLVCASTNTVTSNIVTMAITPSVSQAVSVAITSGTNPQCLGASTTFTATSTNGGTLPSYQWKINGVNVGTNSSAFTTSSLTNGQIVTCTITSNGTCVANPSATSNGIVMVVNTTSAPTVSIAQTTGTNPMCVANYSGFTATSTNGGSAPTYQWQIDGVNAGTNNYYYYVSNLTSGQVVSCIMTSSSACATTPTVTSNTITVAINPTVTPTVSISQTGGSNPECAGASATFTATSTDGGSSPSYHWKVNSTYITYGTTFATSSLVNGDIVACVLTSNAACTSVATITSSGITMVVNSSTPSVSIALTSGSNPECSGASATFTATPANGGATPSYQWQVNGVNAGTNTTTFTTSALTNGQIITCIMTPNTSCGSNTAVSSNAISVVVNPLVTPSVSIAQTSGTNPECVGASATFNAFLVNGGAAPVYQWQVNGVNTGTNSTTFTSTALTSGQTVTCILTSNATCVSTPTVTSNGITMAVNAILTPAVSIALTSGTNPQCTAASATFTATPTNGGVSPVYQWKSGTTNVGTNSNTYTSSTITNGQTITCVMTTSLACVTVATATSGGITMTVYPATLATPGAITGAVTGLCPIGIATTNYSIAAVPNATSYIWTPPTGTTITSGQGTTGITLSIGSTFTAGNLSVTANNICVTSVARVLALKSVPASPTVLTGPAAGLCPSGVATATYITTATTGAISYLWVVPAGVTIVSGQGTTALNVSFGSTFTSGNITVASTNACGTTAAKALAIKSVLAAPGVITGIVAGLCPAGIASATYSIVAVSGATTYNWTVPTGATITAGQGTTAVTVSFGSAFVSGNVSAMAVNACGNSAARTLAIKALLAPPASITGPSNVCGTTTATYTTTATTGATSYSWMVPAGMIIASGQGTTSIVTTFTGTAMATGLVKVASINACGTSAYKTLSIAACANPITMTNGEGEENTISIYPNPTTGELGIRNYESGIKEVQIYNVLGECVFKTTVTGNQSTIDIQQLKAGMYFVRLTDGDNNVVYTQRVIKQ